MNTSLLLLSVAHNKIGRNGHLALASLLQVNTSLAHLNVASTDADATSVIAYCTVLAENHTLQTLDLSRPLLPSKQASRRRPRARSRAGCLQPSVAWAGGDNRAPCANAHLEPRALASCLAKSAHLLLLPLPHFAPTTRFRMCVVATFSMAWATLASLGWRTP
jgi:hypothetical protein